MPCQTLHISDISCNHCINTIKDELGEMPGVISISGDVAAKTITINWQQPASLNDILTVLEDIGYPTDKA